MMGADLTQLDRDTFLALMEMMGFPPWRIRVMRFFINHPRLMVFFTVWAECRGWVRRVW